ncbi:Hypothetical predicted protein [Octopus vulgaris]|uniref:Uncharacterized protein n=1 Tax=Octopus vulgaris TaxID=6645 RepID=A0AA36FK99_OCTVU|nr:Hypothetical predicted protein [Octopus vulgaris]
MIPGSKLRLAIWNVELERKERIIDKNGMSLSACDPLLTFFDQPVYYAMERYFENEISIRPCTVANGANEHFKDDVVGC